MDVRRLALRACASLVAAACLLVPSGCKGTRESIEDMDWSWRPRSRPTNPKPNLAQLWEDGYGFNNPNGEAIRNGTKKPGDKPTKKNPFYESEYDKRRRLAAERKDEIQFVEPKFDAD